MVKKAVILAGGLGTRFAPASFCCAKEMFPVVDLPVMFYHLKECVECGIADVLIVAAPSKTEIKKFVFPKRKILEKIINSNEEQVKQYLDVIKQLKIKIVYQIKPKGSGDAVLMAKKWSKGQPFVVFNGDDLFDGQKSVLKQLIAVYGKTNKTVCAIQKVPKKDISKFGCAKVEKNNNYFELQKIIEKPTSLEAPSQYAIVGRYVFDKNIFNKLKQVPCHNGEYYVVDAINCLAMEKLAVAVKICAKHCDCGNKLEFAKTFVKFVLKRADLKDDFSVFIKKLSSRMEKTWKTH